MFRFFKKREDVFHKLIEEQASLTLDGLKLLAKYLETHDSEIADQLSLKEKEADEVRRILIDELNRSFVTPFDREDIYALSRAVDDVIDYANTTVQEMRILKVQPCDALGKLTDELAVAADEILKAVERIKDHPNVANEHARRAKKAEN